MEAETLSEARVYVGAFGKYNNGSLLGVWLDLSDYSDKEDFYAFCREFCNDEEDADDLVRDFQDEYLGQYDDEEDFAYQIVKVRFDEPKQWDDDLYTEDWACGRKMDEFSTLHHLRLLADEPNFQTMTLVFGEPISQIDCNVFEDVSTWGVSSLQVG